MSARLRSEGVDEKGDGKTAHHRHEDDVYAPGARRGVHIRVVESRKLAQKEDVVNKADQSAKGYGANPGDDSDGDRDEREA